MTVHAAECSFRGADGALLRFDVHETVAAARGVCVTVHGLGEHFGKYAEWITYALERGYHVSGYDQRGHGRTRGPRGDFAFADLSSDLARFVAVSADRFPDLPLFVLAHSLGALVALSYAGGPVHPRVAGMALSGPPLALARESPRWMRTGVRALARIAPRLPLPRGTDPDRLTRDPERAAALRADPLFHTVMTPRAMIDVDAAMRVIRTTPESVRLPLLFLVARADAVVSGADVVAYAHFVASRDVTVEQLPGAYHEVLNDFGRRAVFDRICDWFDARAG